MTSKSIYQVREDVNIYLIDSHRPYFHRNVNASKRIYIIHDGCKSFEDCPNANDEQ